MITLVVFACAIALPMLAWIVYYQWMFWGIRHVPTMKYFAPVIGHAINVRPGQDALRYVYETMLRMKAPLLRINIGNLFVFAVSDPSYLEHLMKNTSTLDKAYVYRFAHRWVGTGLVLSGGSKWRARRKLLTPAYQFKQLNQFTNVFEKNGKILIEKLRLETEKESINIAPYMSLCALDIICETAMGTAVNAQANSNSIYVDTITEQASLVADRSVNVLKHSDFLYKFTDAYRRETRNLKVLHDYTNSIIRERRKELRESSQINRNTDAHDNTGDNDVGMKRGACFLDILLQNTDNGQLLSEEDLREEVDTFMFGGYDTVATSLSFTSHCISKHPDVQARLIDEQRAIFDDDPHRMATLADLNQMSYLEMVIKEAMRLYPAVPFAGRVVTEDTQVNDCHVRKGTEIMFGIMSMHHDERLYPNPEHFDPERFTPEAQAKRHPYAYMPFSGGPRICIAMKFAMFEMKSILSMLVRNYVLKEAPNSSLELKFDVMLGSRTGINVKLQSRNW